jgi:hypothetical protein
MYGGNMNARCYLLVFAGGLTKLVVAQRQATGHNPLRPRQVPEAFSSSLAIC